MTESPHRMHLTVIGQLRLKQDGRELDLPSRSARWLLGCLALSPGLRADRSMLASQFWEERPDARARQNLRQALHALRQTLEPGFSDAVWSSREQIGLDPNRVSIDLDTLFAELDRGEAPDILVTQAGLPGLILADIDPPENLFTSWLHLRRMEIESRLRERLNANLAGQAGEPAARTARALLALDPSDENACRALMRESVRAGATAKALEAYARLWNHLDEEYGIEPSVETQELVAEIKMQAAAPAPPSPPAQRPRIRVGALETTTTDVEAAQVLRLFRTELISRLVRFREWQIFDAEFQPSDCEYELRLSGTTVAGRISVVAVLTDVRDGHVVWGETSQGVAEDWLDFHTRIASRLASSCNINVSFSRLTSLAARPAESAFDNWLLGQTRMMRFRREDLEEAMRLYEEAARHDPRFARAYASQSQLLNIRHLCVPGMMRDADTINRSLKLANQAVSIDPADAQAHLCRGWACMHLAEWAHAQVSFDLALRCNQDDPWAVISIALAAAFRGEHQRAAELSDRFLDEGWTNSAINWGYLANIRFLAGDFEGAAAAAESAGAASLNIPAWHAAALANLGRTEAAAAQWRIFEDLVRPQWSGAPPASTSSIREWLISGFPIRREAERSALADGVDMAIAHLGDRHAHCAQV